MAKSWQELLRAEAAFDPQGKAVFNSAHFPADVVRHDHSLAVPLSHYTCLSISGPDTHKFLQGQLTCNMQDLSPQQALSGALCTPKGRMVSNFYLQYMAADQVLMVLPRATLAATQATLSKYIVFSKAQMQVAERWCHMGLAGPQAEALLSSLLGEAPTQRLRFVANDQGAATCVSSQQQRYLLTLNTADLNTWWQKLSADITPCSSSVWDAMDIDAGLGFVQAATVEMFIPQMLNLQLTDGISFSKGCYTGQEIVARTQYRGNLKRQMYRAGCAAAAVPEPGAPLFNDKSAQPVGNVVMAEHTAAGQVEMLAVIALSESRQETLHAGEKGGPVLQLLDLPYRIDN